MLRIAEIDSNGMVVKCDAHNLPKPCIICAPANENWNLHVPDDTIATYHKLWRELHNASEPSPEWLAEWEGRLPKFCDCGEGYREIIQTLEPTFGNDWFRWTFYLRNRVREKLGKPLFSWCDALAIWRPHLRWAYQQAKFENCIAVTSLAPHRFERQTACLESWKQLGLEIVSVNSQAEIDSMGTEYPQIAKWAAADFERTPKINSLIDVAVFMDSPILVINSDIEMFGDQSRLADLVANRKNAIGIRHNYKTQPGDATIEPWGLDAFLIYPEQVASISRVDFCIGKPMWDYWLANELESNQCEWIGEPYFFHRSHPVAWTQEECTAAHDAYAKRFKPMDWAAWRRSKPFGLIAA